MDVWSEPPSAAVQAYNQLEARVHTLECLRFQVAAEHSDLLGLRAQIDELPAFRNALCFWKGTWPSSTLAWLKCGPVLLLPFRALAKFLSPAATRWASCRLAMSQSRAPAQLPPEVDTSASSAGGRVRGLNDAGSHVFNLDSLLVSAAFQTSECKRLKLPWEKGNLARVFSRDTDIFPRPPMIERVPNRNVPLSAELVK